MKWRLTISGDESEVKDLLESLVKVVGNHARKDLEPFPESKYSPFHRYLLQQKAGGETMLELSLDEIQSIIGTQLPNSAYDHDAFWRDRSRNIGASIVQSGWQIRKLERDSSNKIRKIELRSYEQAPRLKSAEKTIIADTLQEVKGDKAEAARLLGIPLRKLYRKLEEFDLR